MKNLTIETKSAVSATSFAKVDPKAAGIIVEGRNFNKA
jgi:hypothetical protein